MEFKMSEKSKNNWQNMIEEIGVESQMTEEALNRKKMKEFAEKGKKEAEHLAHLKKYHFSSTDEFVDFLKSGGKAEPEYGYFGEGIQYWDKPEQFWQGYNGGPRFRVTTMMYSDIDMPMGLTSDYMDEEDFRKWVDKLFSFGEKHLDNGYLPVWHKVLKD